MHFAKKKKKYDKKNEKWKKEKLILNIIANN